MNKNIDFKSLLIGIFLTTPAFFAMGNKQFVAGSELNPLFVTSTTLNPVVVKNKPLEPIYVLMAGGAIEYGEFVPAKPIAVNIVKRADKNIDVYGNPVEEKK